MRYWLMKSEPDDTSIDDLAAEPERLFEWTGVRNYQARNFMRDGMQTGDRLLFWHSSCPEPGVAGLAEIAAAAHPDSSQFDPESPYYDPKSSPDAPRWLAVDVRFLRKTRLLSPTELRQHPPLAEMTVLKRGNRLSITPLSEDEWRYITEQLLAC
ncbi:EVE domain-containing protein [Chromobacterium alkanivorans]|uniref:EVE domain-containing protein n=1 Tax=Chromobacterium alkanivorans TaxID=1071719 RepID=UPI00196727CD|nr:EVE domain-containing protein [Chromobacterium alkanivorans]MBN3004061.1 EVE domain-containing protein [Chromobacterium alkanivorans]